MMPLHAKKTVGAFFAPLDAMINFRKRLAGALLGDFARLSLIPLLLLIASMASLLSTAVPAYAQSAGCSAINNSPFAVGRTVQGLDEQWLGPVQLTPGETINYIVSSTGSTTTDQYGVGFAILGGIGGDIGYVEAQARLGNEVNLNSAFKVPDDEPLYLWIFGAQSDPQASINAVVTCGSSAPSFSLTPADGEALTTGRVNAAYSETTISASGGVGAITYGATGLPPGLNIDPSSGDITGTPTVDGTFTITVTATAATSGSATATYTIVIDPPPTVNSVSPTSGSTAGGETVTITGTALTGATGVTFGGTAATDVTVVSATQITVTTPAHAAGTVDVTVTTLVGTGTGTGVFTYVAPNSAPTITELSPRAGPTAGDTSVSITGTGFTGVTGVSFGSTPAISYVVNSDTSITAVSPSGMYTAWVTVTTAAGTSATGYQALFTYVPKPTVINISPPSGPSTGGTSVVISGNQLGNVTDVLFGGTPATFTPGSFTEFTAVAPAHAAGVVDVVVKTIGGSDTLTTAFTYTAPILGPTVTSVAPSTGSSNGGEPVTITGADFTGATTVTFDGVPAQSFSVSSPTEITAVTPAGNAGPVDVAVTTPSGQGTLPDGFSYDAPAPLVTSVYVPASGTYRAGDTLVFNVDFDQSVTVTGTPQLVLDIGGVARSAIYATGNGTTNLSFRYTVQAGDLDANGIGINPSISLNGGTIASAGGTAADLTLRNIAALNAVLIDAVAPSVTSAVLVGSPASDATAVAFAVRFSEPVIGVSLSDFALTMTGSVTGAVTGIATSDNTTYSISVSGISGLGSLRLDVLASGLISDNVGNPLASNFTSGTPWSRVGSTDAQLSALAPSAGSLDPSFVAGTFAYTIAVANGTDTISLTPTAVDANATITVNGQSVSSGSASPAVALAVGSTSVPVIVTAQDGVTTNTYTITVNRAAATPTVTSVTPNSGTTAGGETVTVTGTGFTGATAVTIGGTAATSFTVDSATQITAVAPAHPAGTVDVAVSTPAGTGTGTGLYSYTVDVTTTTTSVTASPNPSVTGQTVEIVAAVTAAAPATDTPTGTVTFTGPNSFNQTVALDGSGAASLSTTTLASGTVTATYNGTAGFSGSADTVNITVNAAVTLTLSPAGGELLEAMAGEDYSQPIAATGGIGPLIYSLVSGTLPGGMILNVSTGELTGPIAADAQGEYTFTIQVRDNSGNTGAATYTLKVQPRTVTAADKVVNVPAGATPTNVYLNRGATGGPFTAADLAFIEPANAGTASIIQGELAQAGPITRPVGWYLKFTPNPAYSGQVRVGYRLTSALGVSNTGTVTYNLAYDAAAVAADIEALVKGFVGARQNLIASAIKVPGLVERRRMGSASDPVLTRVMPSQEGITLGFSTSLAQLEAARNKADGISGVTSSPFNIWIEGAFMAHNRGENDDRWGNFAMISLGADYLLSEKALFGLSFHYDYMTDPTDEDAELTGNGWLAGPYASFEIGKGVFWDTSLLYGSSANNIDTAFWDGTFDTTRWLFDTSINGQWNIDEVTVLTPKVRAVYFTEDVEGYSVENGAGDMLDLNGFTEEQLRVSLGAEIARQFMLENGMTLTPSLGGTVGFSGLDGDGVFGSVSAGLSLQAMDAWSIDAGLLVNIEGDGQTSAGAKVGISGRF